MNLGFCIYFLNIFILVYCGYPPTGDEVQAGSVLLPASRRGRYLANIVRRQAVDGTGINFNKDADRMNAEAKKKVDVLSEELLPYIIAEQERRTTLYKRVMTAIQNGEKGVTVAEIRNKPPLIIRKGLMYRCPTNRAPKEPDGSGIIMCEDEISPTSVMYDSCLSAEDKELYVAENRYFFCNRHKIEGPDLPRNGTTVIGCAPLERTSLNYTTQKCALEDTDDVVVHYRYYPDRTYKFVTELDPDREVCDHWNPCQIGYIYSLPSTDQAMPANELWQFVPSIPEDTAEEFVKIGEDYHSNLRKILIPSGYSYHGIGRWDSQANTRVRLTAGPLLRTPSDFVVANVTNLIVTHRVSGVYLSISITFEPFMQKDIANYYVRLVHKKSNHTKFIENVLILREALTQLKALVMDQLPGQTMNKTNIHLSCSRCTLQGVMLRGDDGSVVNVDPSKYRLRSYSDHQKYIELHLEGTRAEDFGDYFALIQNEDGSEEKVKLISLQYLKLERLETSLEPGAHFDATVKYDCDECTLTDVMCNGESVLVGGRVTILPAAKQISFNFPSFDDESACVYIGIFKTGEKTVKKELAVIENAYVQFASKRSLIPAPVEGEQFEQQIPFTCEGECSVQKMTINGVQLNQETNSRRFLDISLSVSIGSSVSRAPFFTVINFVIFLRFPFFSPLYTGIFLATFSTPHGPCTRNVLEIGTGASNSAAVTDGEATGISVSESYDISESTEALEESTPAASVESSTTEGGAALSAGTGETAASAGGEAAASAAPAEEGAATSAAPAEGETAAPAEGETAAPAEGETAAPAEGETAAPAEE